jgi:SPP1 family holin|nr:MAG TPA: holin [Caudoviricetes sp.]
MKNETIKAFIRLLVAAILMLNSVLTAKGLNPIPFDETAFSNIALQIATGLSVLWLWWKNNNVTRAAKEAQNYKKALQEDGDGSDSLEEEV